MLQTKSKCYFLGGGGLLESFAINEDIFDCIVNCFAEVERIMEKTSNGHNLLQLLCKQLKTCGHIWIRTRQERLAELSFDNEEREEEDRESNENKSGEMGRDHLEGEDDEGPEHEFAHIDDADDDANDVQRG